MSLVGIAGWTAQSNPLELVELNIPTPKTSAFALVPELLKSGSPWLENVYPPDRRRVRNYLTGRNPARRRKSIDYRLIVGDGEPLWVRHWLLSSVPASPRRRKLHGFLLAIPEQKHLEWECLRVSERERHRIGQELHDDLCQVLAGLGCMVQNASRRTAKRAPVLAQELNDLQRELAGATTRVRAMAHGLFPAQLDYFTLRHALIEFARQTRIRLSVKFIVEFSGRLPAHSPDHILHIYRIVQEAVGNAVRHGKATAIHIFVAADRQQMSVRVEDNGAGFPATAARPEGIGLHAMQYRAGLLAGEIRFRNLSRHGAIVELKYPVDAGPGHRRRLDSSPCKPEYTPSPITPSSGAVSPL